SPNQGPAISALAVPSNRMVAEAKPERHMLARNAEERAHLARLLLDPFVARVEVEWLKSGPPQTTYYFARRSAVGLTTVIKGAAFVPSGAKLGALAEYDAGEVAAIEISGVEREARILTRVVLSSPTGTRQIALATSMPRPSRCLSRRRNRNVRLR